MEITERPCGAQKGKIIVFEEGDHERMVQRERRQKKKGKTEEPALGPLYHGQISLEPKKYSGKLTTTDI